jgi:hypothetical protein
VALPRSRVTPLLTCPALRPRWCPAHSPWRTQDCGLPAHGNRRLSPPCCGGSPRGPRLDLWRGSLTRPVTSLPCAPHLHDWVRTSGSRLTGWRGVGQVGREPSLSPTGSHPRVSWAFSTPLPSCFAWRDHAVVRLELPRRATVRFPSTSTLTPVLGRLPAARAPPPRSFPVPTYWITLSASARMCWGIVSPSALAVLRLMVSSNCIGNSAGISAGLVPRRILPTMTPARRAIAAKA